MLQSAVHDSTAKSVTGILRGSIFQFGHFEECLSAKAPFATQYCLTAISADVPPPDPPRDSKSLWYNPNEIVLRKIYDHKDPSQQPENSVLVGWCIPATCSASDLRDHLNKYLDEVKSPFKERNVTYVSHIDEKSCQTKDEIQYLDHIDISFCLVSVIIAALVVASTIFDVILQHEEKLSRSSPLQKLALSFSLKNNFAKLTRNEDSNSALQILYGMRVFCILMIIIDHRFGTFLSSGILNFNTVEFQYRSTFGTLFFHGDLFVDSFFILSGILVSYCLLVQFEKKFINPGILIIMRYIRLTPLYAYVIFFCATIFNFTGSGAMWKTIVTPEVQDCRENWWINLLYISNYVKPEKMCMVHTWYLPCDFHYFILALPLCLAIHKNKKVGLILLGVCTFLSVLVPFIIIFLHSRPAVLFFYLDFIRSPKTHTDFLFTYIKSHVRAAPYCIGMIAGYLFYRMRQQKSNLSLISSYLVFFVSLILMIGSITTGAIFYNPYYKYNALESAAYAALHRAVWSVGSVGILYVSSYGHVKLVYNFLSWKPWIPLSKLVYGAYLVHFQFQLRAVAKKSAADTTTYFDIISYGLSDAVLAFSTAFVLYLAVEAPFRNIFSLLFFPPKENQQVKSKEENVSETTCDSHL
ncbi:nose resistant to fluoxetine protein 6-like isoform X2 [Cylas formicarius]|uniref:nose resistant to fluoxetine protein 6-like isoform X2 n=1 Tax=Cylas formicarius TaxID=197179 RepID=UPI002958B74E|nr:nose resistant to fluoxetine protein 6-like isoform X2 [Cylas formicarius]